MPRLSGLFKPSVKIPLFALTANNMCTFIGVEKPLVSNLTIVGLANTIVIYFLKIINLQLWILENGPTIYCNILVPSPDCAL
jgi:hypothetical protein